MASELPATPRFFILESDPLWSRYDIDVDEIESLHGEKAARCPKCGSAIGLLPWLPPYRARLVLHGEELGDFIKCTGDELLVSERFAQAFREEGLTGLTGFHPVEIVRVSRKRRGPKPSHVPSYQVVTPCFGRAAVDMAHSRIRYESPPTCEECLTTVKNAIHGYRLVPGTWQGEDIFHPRGLQGCLTVSERFARFVVRHGFTNMRLTPIEEHVWDPLAPKPVDASRQGTSG
jgi:hypothetical protein